jgi:hypothetical protein
MVELAQAQQGHFQPHFSALHGLKRLSLVFLTLGTLVAEKRLDLTNCRRRNMTAMLIFDP